MSPLSLLYKIIHYRPAKQQGGGPWGVKYAVFPEEHWTDAPNLEPFNLVLGFFLAGSQVDVMSFPYSLVLSGNPIPAPLPGKVYGERFVMLPVYAGVMSAPVECLLPMNPDPEKSLAWQMSVLMSEREESLLADPGNYPKFHY